MHADTSQWARRPGPIARIDLQDPRATIGKTPRRVADIERTPQSDNDAMVVLALILLVLVAVLAVGIAVSNPDIYDLSIFGAVVTASSSASSSPAQSPWQSPSLALLLLRTGIRRGRARRKEIKELQAASDKGLSASPEETSTTAATTSDASAASDSGTTEPTRPPLRSRASIGERRVLDDSGRTAGDVG